MPHTQEGRPDVSYSLYRVRGTTVTPMHTQEGRPDVSYSV